MQQQTRAGLSEAKRQLLSRYLAAKPSEAAKAIPIREWKN